ncbi:MAG: TIR domain-containing protein [Novosphingobium sp.]|uniref:TIR domain-containing protein n=1 Tax=Novosphingobium sp. TaxID=1874826 RepID=UPI0032BECECA
MSDFRYKAFVSYSWADAAWGKWLHRAIETFRTPKVLVDSEGRNGPVPARLFPLFKDREEEAAGSSIGAAVESALASSEFLIVVCSPRSAQSKWVDREIAWFKTHRNPANILALIVDGSPGAANIPGSEDEECFPRALTHAVGAAMEITDRPVDAPLAADARDSGDGKRGARLKLAAALLGVGLDDLVRRDDRRRARVRTAATAGSLAVATTMSALAWSATVARDEAVFQRNESQDLTEFMLTDLRGKLDEVGRLDILESVGTRLMISYGRQDLRKLDADALGRRARVQLLLGEIENSRGNLTGALKSYQAASATTAELLARDPDEPQRMFDHAQSLYWVGYIAWQRGDLNAAKRQFEGYAELADRLVAADPDKFEWQLEQSYAQSNLGTVAADRGDLDAASKHFSAALVIDKRFYESKPGDADAVIQYGSTLSWSAKVAGQRFDFRQSEALYGVGAGIFAKAFEAEPENYALLSEFVPISLNHTFSLVDLGQAEQAAEQGQKAVALAAKLADHDAANTDYLNHLTWTHLAYAEALLGRGDLAGAQQQVGNAAKAIVSIKASDIAKVRWRVGASHRVQLLSADIARARGVNGSAEKQYAALLQSLAALEMRSADAGSVSIFVSAHVALGELTRDPVHWRAINGLLDAAPQTMNARASVGLARALFASGRRTEGIAIVKRLQAGGYAASRFLTLVRGQGLASGMVHPSHPADRLGFGGRFQRDWRI